MYRTKNIDRTFTNFAQRIGSAKVKSKCEVTHCTYKQLSFSTWHREGHN